MIRPLPANLDAERFILGSILLDNAYFIQVASVLDLADFSLEKHRRIFAAMQTVYGAGGNVDRVTVANELMRQKQLESVDGLSYLVSLDDGLPQIFNLDSYVQIVKEKSILRKTIIACQKIAVECYGEGDDAVNLLDRGTRLLAVLSDERQPTGALLRPGEIIERHKNGINGFLSPHQEDPGIRTPWKLLNEVIAGFRPGQFWLIAARPSVGKTAMGMQIALAAAGAGTGTAVFSLEMSGGDLLQRCICQRAIVDFHEFRHGRVDADERIRLQTATSEINDLPLWIDESTGVTVPAIHSGVRKLRARHQIGMVIVDYLQLMTVSGKSENRNQEVSQISRSLKRAAKEFGVPFLVLAQLNRASETARRRPILSDLRESGSLEQDADGVILLHQPENEQQRGPMVHTEVIVAKQRQGPRRMVRLLFHGKYLKFEEESKNEP